MRAYVAVTDGDWYRYLAARPDLDEVNFWQPGGRQAFTFLDRGELLLFKLHFPQNFIVGGGFLTHSTIADARLAWEAFGEKNGASTFDEMCKRIEKYRGSADERRDYTIGCILLRDPFFLPRPMWVSPPPSFKKATQQGKRYDLALGEGLQLWQDILSRMQATGGSKRVVAEPVLFTHGLAKRRLGQGTFRLLVNDVYERRCAVTGERALPALEAAHIRPVEKGGEHRIDNGLLLRSDIHALFDRGYVTVTPDHRFKCSIRLKRDFNNGEHYRQMDGTSLMLPKTPELRPSAEFLEWHVDTVFRG